MGEGLVVVCKVEERHMLAAAEITYDGFEAKIRHALGSREPALPLLTEALADGRMLGAIWDDELVGICLLVTVGESAMRLSVRSFIKHFGFWRGIYRSITSVPLSVRAKPGELFVDMLAVRGDQRGRGVGTALLREAFAVAEELGTECVRLQVVDTNPRARALYERMGFRATKTRRVPILGPMMGFNAYTTMVRPVGEDGG